MVEYPDGERRELVVEFDSRPVHVPLGFDLDADRLSPVDVHLGAVERPAP